MLTHQIHHRPAYAQLELTLPARESLLVESGSMAAMDSSITMKSRMRGGAMGGIQRMLSGESFFMSEFTAGDRPGRLYISPAIPGDIQHYQMRGDRALMVQSSGFVASSPTVELDTQFQGFKGFFSGEALFLLRATGRGDLWFSSYGAVLEVPVDGDYVVDTGYIVAFEDSLTYNVEMLGGLSFRGLRTGIFGGEGLVCRFRGQGRLWIQSRNLYSLVNFLNPFRPTQSN